MSARGYAEALLEALACEAAGEKLAPSLDARSAGERWAESGMLALTGRADGPTVVPTVALPNAADGALAALAALAPEGAFAGLAGGAELLGERAVLAGLGRRGRISAGGGARLLPTRDAWLAVNLPRADDVRLLPAWLEDDAFEGIGSLDPENWERLGARLAERKSAECVERARWLGLPVASAGPSVADLGPWLRVSASGGFRERPERARPSVVDLSSLWAGPLAGRLLRLAGARVIKVESTRRPDGARHGSPPFFERLNAGKQSVALDLAAPEGRAALARLLAGADLVIESSRPRALQQLGIEAAAWVAERPGRVWLSITGYGRADDGVAFGDDAAAAAGLCWCVPTDAPLFVGDAIADPLTGIHAALAALAFWRRGECALLDVSLAAVVAHAVARVGQMGSGVRARDT